jgi:hypothetical protein
MSWRVLECVEQALRPMQAIFAQFRRTINAQRFTGDDLAAIVIA